MGAAMDDDLVKRLKDIAVHSYLGRAVIEEAAARIAALTKRNDWLSNLSHTAAEKGMKAEARISELVEECDQLEVMARDYAEEAAALRDRVARLEGALEGVTSAAQQMLSEAQKTGVLDNILPEIFPDAKTRGTRADMGLKQLDAARNNLRAHTSTARAILALIDGGK